MMIVKTDKPRCDEFPALAGNVEIISLSGKKSVVVIILVFQLISFLVRSVTESVDFFVQGRRGRAASKIV